MSDLRLPYGTSVLAQLFRPMRGAPQVGIASMLFHRPGTADDIARDLSAKRERMLAALQDFLHPGVPVCLVMSVTLPDGDTEALTAIVEIPRAQRREDLGEQLFSQVPALVDALFEMLRLRLTPVGAS